MTPPKLPPELVKHADEWAKSVLHDAQFMSESHIEARRLGVIEGYKFAHLHSQARLEFDEKACADEAANFRKRALFEIRMPIEQGFFEGARWQFERDRLRIELCEHNWREISKDKDTLEAQVKDWQDQWGLAGVKRLHASPYACYCAMNQAGTPPELFGKCQQCGGMR